MVLCFHSASFSASHSVSKILIPHYAKLKLQTSQTEPREGGHISLEEQESLLLQSLTSLQIHAYAQKIWLLRNILNGEWEEIGFRYITPIYTISNNTHYWGLSWELNQPPYVMRLLQLQTEKEVSSLLWLLRCKWVDEVCLAHLTGSL